MKRAIVMTLAGLAVVAVWLISACSEDQAAEMQADFKAEKADLMGKVRAAIDSVDHRINELQSQSAKVAEDMSGEIKAHADTLRAGMTEQLEQQKQALTKKMSDLQGATMDNLESMQADVNELIEETRAMLTPEDTSQAMSSGRSG